MLRAFSYAERFWTTFCSVYPHFHSFYLVSIAGWKGPPRQKNMQRSIQSWEKPSMLSFTLTIFGMTTTLSPGTIHASNLFSMWYCIYLIKQHRGGFIKYIKCIQFVFNAIAPYCFRQHTGGFYPSNLAPLYSDCIPPSLDLNSVADKILEFNETLSQPGGPPSSTVESRWRCGGDNFSNTTTPASILVTGFFPFVSPISDQAAVGLPKRLATPGRGDGESQFFHLHPQGCNPFSIFVCLFVLFHFCLANLGWDHGEPQFVHLCPKGCESSLPGCVSWEDKHKRG